MERQLQYYQFKKSKEYKKAVDVNVFINGNGPIDEMYYPDELDGLLVVGVGYKLDGTIDVDLIDDVDEDR